MSEHSPRWFEREMPPLLEHLAGKGELLVLTDEPIQSPGLMVPSREVSRAVKTDNGRYYQQRYRSVRKLRKIKDRFVNTYIYGCIFRKRMTSFERKILFNRVQLFAQSRLRGIDEPTVPSSVYEAILRSQESFSPYDL